MGYSSTQVIALGAVCGALPIPFVALRFYSRTLTPAGFKIDDWLILPALEADILELLTVGMGAALIIDGVLGELGTHQSKQYGPDSQPVMHDALKIYEQVKFTIQLSNIAAVGLCKLSLLFLFRRIFSTQPFKRVVDVSIAIATAWLLGFWLASLFQCTPVNTIWTRWEREYAQYCFDVVKFYWAIGVTDAVTDLLIMVLPIPMIWKLQMPIKQRVAVGGMFLAGSLVIAASVARLVIFLQVGAKMELYIDDVTYHTTPVFYWSAIEGALACISVCLPTLRPALLRLFPALVSGFTTNHSPSPSARWSWIVSRIGTRPAGARPFDPELGDPAFGNVVTISAAQPMSECPVKFSKSQGREQRGGGQELMFGDGGRRGSVPVRPGELSRAIMVKMEVSHEREGPESEDEKSDVSSEKDLESL
ncbi:hypothetical protein P152DRAFT_449194 [Eremomyces bilateralis CBS 781.70]|uniref:Rhodopsin domain-containing protein n=1 Tax=Eremomyces bilateralis CBS 781.70 TaxID=1392243 RepID=A0A6G1G3F5_9PEZI|nr:uncharacterized protein P152DRAFT_449194 [Eremomyces bilateralis CBS 781.70]KAF1812450.1 hypothetical protein P152DRAFT_449194 [Eremomyces bilateralis CBS 781.70]